MNSQAVWMQGDGFESSPLTVHSSLGLVKPSVSTPPSPNEVTEFSVRPLSADLYPGKRGMWVQPPTEHEVRGRMQVVFLWRASNDFGSQLSTLTGPLSYGGLGTTSSTSPHAIFSHMDRFSLQQ